MQTPEQLLLLAQSQLKAGHPAETESTLKQLLHAHPGFHPAWHDLGLLALQTGNLPLAADLLAQAVALCDDAGNYHSNLGEILRRLGRLDEAATACLRATLLLPDDAGVHYNLGVVLSDQHRWSPAIAAYQRALELAPEHGLSWNNLGSALEKRGDLSDAEAAYARAVELNATHVEAQNNLGALYSAQGRIKEAIRCFEAAIKADPDFAEAHFNLSEIRTYTPDDPCLLILERIFRRRETLPADARIRFCFALGKALEDTRRYDEAFFAYAEGNRLKHAMTPYAERRTEKQLQDIVATFDCDFIDQRSSQIASRTGDNAPVPIFIVGMPRSGTTLLEQILSCHPEVHAAGELSDLYEVIKSASNGQSFPGPVRAFTPEVFVRLGETYRARIKQLAAGRRFVIDKMPANFFLLGMVKLMLPDAKIIHAMRDPMDSCFSNYARLFTDSGMEFTYDLGTLGRYYLRYAALMAHWHKVLPAGSILNLRYEELVDAPEMQISRILDFIGLPWHDGCLAFHDNKRNVQTASHAQVRKPIYRTSVARWKHFDSHLQTLLGIVSNQY